MVDLAAPQGRHRKERHHRSVAWNGHERLDQWIDWRHHFQRLAVAAFDPMFLTGARAVIAGLVGLTLLLMFRQRHLPVSAADRLANSPVRTCSFREVQLILGSTVHQARTLTRSGLVPAANEHGNRKQRYLRVETEALRDALMARADPTRKNQCRASTMLHYPGIAPVGWKTYSCGASK
jgi:hypothetical protein